MPYDPEETKRIAEELQKHARSVPLVFAIAGATIGSFTAGVASPQWIVFSVSGGIIGGLLGYLAGIYRALSLRAKAQSLLCQVKIEENTRGGAPREI